jgi:hypothetical protein
MLPSELGARERLPPLVMRRGEGAGARALNASPPPTADRVDKLYRQLVEIHTIADAQLVEFAH